MLPVFDCSVAVALFVLLLLDEPLLSVPLLSAPPPVLLAVLPLVALVFDVLAEDWPLEFVSASAGAARKPANAVVAIPMARPTRARSITHPRLIMRTGVGP